MNALALRPDGVYIDATAGGGGHLRQIVASLDKRGMVVGLDRDPDAIARCRASITGAAPAVILEQSPFSRIDEVLDTNGIPAIDGLLLDLGVSSHQIDDDSRGFTYMRDAPLDMRMDPAQPTDAAAFIADADEAELARVLSTYGEITNPGRMARAIKRCSPKRPLTSSRDLRGCLRREYGDTLPVSVIARVFQALRIALNRELDELSECLGKVLPYVKKGGRIAVISYHSLEDRIVKNFIRDCEKPCVCPPAMPVCRCGKKILLKRITKKVIVPSRDEVRDNPRARSARLRVAEKTVDGDGNGER